MHKVIHKRIFWGLLILSALLAVLILRLAWVQLLLKNQPVPGAEYSLARMAEIQSERETVLDSGRGRLYDRSGKPLAGETVWAAAFFRRKNNLLLPLARERKRERNLNVVLPRSSESLMSSSRAESPE